jgi:hypothetical protein
MFTLRVSDLNSINWRQEQRHYKAIPRTEGYELWWTMLDCDEPWWAMMNHDGLWVLPDYFSSFMAFVFLRILRILSMSEFQASWAKPSVTTWYPLVPKKMLTNADECWVSSLQMVSTCLNKQRLPQPDSHLCMALNYTESLLCTSNLLPLIYSLRSLEPGFRRTAKGSYGPWKKKASQHPVCCKHQNLFTGKGTLLCKSPGTL